MSTLNLALQHVALARRSMEPDLEEIIKGKNTLGEVRKILVENPGLEDALRDLMQGPIMTLADRFKAMKIKEQGVGVAFAASEDEIKHALNFIQFLESS